mgnify:CR=1 FL=1
MTRRSRPRRRFRAIVEVASESDAHVTLAGLFDEQVERTPDALALDYAGTQLTYAQFDARANRLARELVAAGVGPDSLVGLAMRRSIDLLVSMYAIVKAGGAYVPLDPDHPADRLRHGARRRALHRLSLRWPDD